jgi:hypothetical protein
MKPETFGVYKFPVLHKAPPVTRISPFRTAGGLSRVSSVQTTSKVVPMPMPVIHSGTGS